MAEVLPPIMQQNSSINMLHSRPSSADAFNASGHSSRPSQTPRSMFIQQGYRGTPVPTYSYQATPHLRQDQRTSSAPGNPYGQHSKITAAVRQGHIASSSTSTSSSSSSSNPSLPSLPTSYTGSKDDSIAGVNPQSASTITLSTSVPDLSFSNFDAPAKASPDRYRRNQRRVDVNASPSKTSATPSGSGMATIGHLYSQPAQRSSSPVPPPVSSVDDMHVTRPVSTELAKRYRRRSLGNMEPKNSSTSVAPGQYGDIQSRSVTRQDSSDNRPVSGASRARSFHERTSSVESASARPSSRQGTSAHGMAATASVQQLSTGVRLEPRTVNIPSRGTADSNKRVNTPSPLSKPVISNDMSAPRSFQSPVRAAEGPEAADTPSPAAQHLAALSDKDLNKGMKSRLRRAFSFGSAAELRKASAENNLSAERARLRKEKYNDERAAEQEAVVQRQEAAGIGAGIYSGQGGFTGSTDNLSISSTASSASMMLRKMGKGMKKSSRSIKGLFRPKSVVGVPAADGPVHSSMAQVSLVTVEAEREKVNVNLHPADQIGGGTGFPKLERNSIDAASAAASEARGSHDGAESLSRRSIVGSDKDRAEVLAAVKKGILKRSGTGSGSSSPVNLPVDMRSTDSGLSSVPHSPTLSAPTTPVSDQRRTASMTAKTADYFAPRFALSVNKSMPSTPQGLSRNITFSPRIQFHDAWSSTEYDRRGDIATCNRLTPMLAQQIKEELNSFKMEMEVHELSKPHTHFF